jgi:hypothetical protein
MKIEQLTIGNWYSISYKHKKDKWKGIAKYIGRAPLTYQPGCLEFMCEDGYPGIFEPSDVVKEILPPSSEELDNLVGTLSK